MHVVDTYFLGRLEPDIRNPRVQEILLVPTLSLHRSLLEIFVCRFEVYHVRNCWCAGVLVCYIAVWAAQARPLTSSRPLFNLFEGIAVPFMLLTLLLDLPSRVVGGFDYADVNRGAEMLDGAVDLVEGNTHLFEPILDLLASLVKQPGLATHAPQDTIAARADKLHPHTMETNPFQRKSGVPEAEPATLGIPLDIYQGIKHVVEERVHGPEVRLLVVLAPTDDAVILAEDHGGDGWVLQVFSDAVESAMEAA
ncbi:hypothetical protein J3F83DRAFT_412375 [Trichoderma novae-zelandiae]